jgi:hypothetical protein
VDVPAHFGAGALACQPFDVVMFHGVLLGG